jgi:hypothetical protein
MNKNTRVIEFDIIISTIYSKKPTIKNVTAPNFIKESNEQIEVMNR